MQKYNPSNEDELFRLFTQEWSKISTELLCKLIESMPRRCQALLKSKGYPIKY